MRSQIKLSPVTVAPAAVETELAALCNGAAQTAIAEACGLSCHTTISERIGKALMGRKGFLAALTGEQVVRLAASHGALGAAIIAYIEQEAASRQPAASLTEEVRREINEDAALIGKCSAVLTDRQMSISDRADLVLSLRESIDHRAQLVAHLESTMKEASRGK